MMNRRSIGAPALYASAAEAQRSWNRWLAIG
jgi:hypothetical protein